MLTGGSPMQDLIETLEGNGQVFDGDKKLADVTYQINVYQDRINTSSHSGTSSIPGLKTVTLNLNKDVGAVGDELVLILEDQRKLRFFVRSSNSYAAMGAIA
jgi:hypothetical protein